CLADDLVLLVFDIAHDEPPYVFRVVAPSMVRTIAGWWCAIFERNPAIILGTALPKPPRAPQERIAHRALLRPQRVIHTLRFWAPRHRKQQTLCVLLELLRRTSHRAPASLLIRILLNARNPHAPALQRGWLQPPRARWDRLIAHGDSRRLLIPHHRGHRSLPRLGYPQPGLTLQFLRPVPFA